MAQEVKVSKFAKFKGNLTKFFKEINSELKKVIWLSKSQLINNTVAVLVMCLFVGVIIWLLDLGFGQLTRLIYK
ncbi:MAG TPA: preprotein translocase subunit SecE [Acetivibrio sp.]|jgi:preprotein translocase subunit SecE|nr:preprotein translocase subunit SecE [Clostridium sp.]HOQ37970.1 preprotein translocase subunit SecE [Acetivibrio sp.]HPT91722.1 preprotein translocase subunit SecE [Acetivibrio sp.]HQA56356.1 preprotein translocase subunit SecE [Acetivibrio sp.]